MPEKWFLRIEAREYGPADLATLLEWKEDGRVLRGNEARLDGSETWISAAEIPDLFAPDLPVPSKAASGMPPVPTPGFFRICFDSVAIYIRGFFLFLGLTLLVVLPGVLSQLIGDMLQSAGGIDTTTKSVLGGLFSLSMLLLTVLAKPLYIVGVQLLTADLALNGHLTFFELLNRSLRFWPRALILCVIVYVSLTFWTVIPFVVVLGIFLSGPSFIAALLILGVGAVQVWIFGRLFINFLFWQQCAVLEDKDVAGSLRMSKEFARRPRPLLPWYKRPLWQGVFIFSLWTAFTLILYAPVLVTPMLDAWKVMSTTTDPQKLIEAMTAAAAKGGGERLSFALSLLHWMVAPLLGIPFVLIFLAARSGEDEPKV